MDSATSEAKCCGKFLLWHGGRRNGKIADKKTQVQKLESPSVSATTIHYKRNGEKDFLTFQNNSEKSSSILSDLNFQLDLETSTSLDDDVNYVEKLSDLIEKERKRNQELLELQSKFHLTAQSIFDTERTEEGKCDDYYEPRNGCKETIDCEYGSTTGSQKESSIGSSMASTGVSRLSTQERLENLQREVEEFRHEISKKDQANNFLLLEVDSLKTRHERLLREGNLLRSKVDEKDKILKDIDYALRRLQESYEKLQKDYDKLERELFKANNEREQIRMDKRRLEDRYASLFEDESKMKNKCKLIQTVLRTKKYHELMDVFKDCRRQLLQKEDEFKDLQATMRDVQSHYGFLYEHAVEEHKRLLLVAKLFFASKNKYKFQFKIYQNAIQCAESCIDQAKDIIDLYDKLDAPSDSRSAMLINEKRTLFAEHMTSFKEYLNKCSDKDAIFSNYKDELQKLLMEKTDLKNYETLFSEIENKGKDL